MSKFFLSAASIFSLLITSLVIPSSVAARRCDEREPLTLLALYRTSDAIYVGRYEKVEDVEVTEETSDYRVVTIKKHFSISSGLKGETRKLLAIDDIEYRYKGPDATNETETEHGEEGSVDETAKPGDSVLLFVTKVAETGALDLTDTIDGIKKMTPEKLAAYEARIKDLKGILAAKKPKHSALVDWMIRSAENPLTRWEGTFELLQSFQNMDWQDERAKEAMEKPAESDEQQSLEAEGPKEFETGDPLFARSMTQAQKSALTNILVNRELPKKSDDGGASSAPVHGDQQLIELVKRWGDSRVASSLLEHLRNAGSEPYVTSELMGSIASMLHNNDLIAVADEYAAIQWESDEDEVRVEGEAPPEAALTSSTDGLPATAETTGINAAKPQTDGPEAEAKKKKTYAQLRAEISGRFVSMAAALIAKEQNKKTAKSKH
ncbi:MAG TPA: hypothetical protein VNA22_04060 [Pyrinomonadaceae bacterium]|nr:hypothetical protein [Pyrinomonadaceae bacterium]